MPKISELNEIASLYANDYFAVAHDTQGLPSTKKITITNLANAVFLTAPNKVLPNGSLTNQFLLANSTGGPYWSDNPGLNNINIINYTESYVATLNDNYIFCDPNDVGPVITIILPSNAPEGKEFNIKNLTGIVGTNYITVTTDSPSHLYIENPETGTFVASYNIYNRGDMQTWIHDGSNYRHIGSQTGTPVFITSANTYQQVVIKNTNSGNNASADLVLYSDQANYIEGNGPFIDVGIDSSSYANNEFSLFGPNDAYVYTGNANLLIGTSTKDTSIKFFTVNTHADNLKLSITNNQIVSNVDIIPSQNSVFGLGTPELQWKHLYVSNTTIYINNIPLSINDQGKILVNNTDIIHSSITDKTPFVLQQFMDVNFNGGSAFSIYEKNDTIINAGNAYTVSENKLDAGDSRSIIIQNNSSSLQYAPSLHNITFTASDSNNITIGYTGSQGFTGSRGYTGTNGLNGFTGSIGFSGSKGDTGPSSNTPGPLGFTGSRGFTGSIGLTGPSSNTPGPLGFTGSRGFNGSKGDTGFVGSASTAPGQLGFTGSIGFTGSRGDTGFVGSASTAPGLTGSIGLTGSRGYTGSASTIPGFNGSTGIGFNGSTGFVGSRGYNGSVGFAGSAGAGSLPSRTTRSVTTSALAVNGSASVVIDGFKGYDIYSIQVNEAAWVTVYTSADALSSDASRDISTSPNTGTGVIAEIVTSGPSLQLITPAVRGFSSENPPTNAIPLKVVNNGTATAAITVTLTLIQTEL